MNKYDDKGIMFKGDIFSLSLSVSLALPRLHNADQVDSKLSWMEIFLIE